MKPVGTDTTVGFIGIGVMGKSMASHLLEGGFSLNVYNRTKDKAKELIKRGAHWCDNPGKVASDSDVVITIVGYPSDVEQIYLGDDGILHHLSPGNIAVDMTTSSPQLAARIYHKAREKGVAVLDAPVSGGDIGAKEGKLSIMVGGDEDVFNAVMPIFSLMGKNIVYQGSAGSGQHCKMANQIAIASTMLGVCESIRYAEKAGLDPGTVLETIASGAAASWSLSNLGPRIINGNFEPGFYVKHFIKDMRIALESSEEIGLSAKGLALAKSMYEELAEQGGENFGTQALYKNYL
ncbi:NAD(P)-dependent oxidoreductase [Desulforhopalus singaporensis]|uniref:3-hydroxyisobutyrate dehydrogenase n=1 Tax=Desulforhopalus singaporensis TaxID=91360 RepID=A0A1H0TZZ0_9BACT|nr:NAD(P)-dependent oxidoreductase [Desulforhopalus singaporensis]SDP59345.1 3-hydroxyisobutyrate dehydrogenase [Desulforhopalus singaporensis]